MDHAIIFSGGLLIGFLIGNFLFRGALYRAESSIRRLEGELAGFIGRSIKQNDEIAKSRQSLRRHAKNL